MTQEEVNVVFSMTSMIHEGFKDKSVAEVHEWVAGQLGQMGIHTIPLGMSWGSLTTEEKHKEYYKNKIS